MEYLREITFLWNNWLFPGVVCHLEFKEIRDSVWLGKYCEKSKECMYGKKIDKRKLQESTYVHKRTHIDFKITDNNA